ncbi:MAG: hypothetical protein HN348_24015, partial [Proteobacteria bacterium]|nr:hypothetical protein [Pseudomonadota bacterium]
MKETPFYPLLAPVHGNPHNLALRQVVADQLIERGHPYGEYIRAAFEAELAEDAEQKVTLQRHAESLLAPHRLEWASVAGRVCWEKIRYRWGFPSHGRVDLDYLPRYIGHPAWSTFETVSAWPAEHRGSDLLTRFARTLAPHIKGVLGNIPLETFQSLSDGPTLPFLTRIDVDGDPWEVIDTLPCRPPSMPSLNRVLLRSRQIHAWTPNCLNLLATSGRLDGLNEVALFAGAPRPIGPLFEAMSDGPVELTVIFGEPSFLRLNKDGSMTGRFHCWDDGLFNVRDIVNTLDP